VCKGILRGNELSPRHDVGGFLIGGNMTREKAEVILNASNSNTKALIKKDI
jgi:hypothetical protein